MMNITFKYGIGQHVYYDDKICQILSRSYMETENKQIIKYNLKSKEEYFPNIWEDELSTLYVIK